MMRPRCEPGFFQEVWESRGGRYALIACLLSFASFCQADEPVDPYEALYDVVMTRQFTNGKTHGQNYQAPLIWLQSHYLLKEPAFTKLVEALDRFNALSKQQVEAYGDLKRALLQRHLWAVFDWATSRRNPAASEPEPEKMKTARMTIQRKVVHAMKLLALSRQQIHALPNPLTAVIDSRAYPRKYDRTDPFRPFLPADLLDQTGPWVCLRRQDDGLAAPLHSEFEAYRSSFLIFMRLPAGRRATLDYLDQLNLLRQPVVIDERGQMRLHPETPQFPVGTQFALVERPLLISDLGKLVVSPLIYRVELRAYLNLDPQSLKELNRAQAVAEFVLQPQMLFQGKPALKALARDETHYSTFTTSDPFENKVDSGNHVRIQNCITCHRSVGIRSFASRHRQLQMRQVDRVLPAILKEGSPQVTSLTTVDHKQRDYTWGVLEVLWRGAGK